MAGQQLAAVIVVLARAMEALLSTPCKQPSRRQPSRAARLFRVGEEDELDHDPNV